VAFAKPSLTARLLEVPKLNGQVDVDDSTWTLDSTGAHTDGKVCGGLMHARGLERDTGCCEGMFCFVREAAASHFNLRCLQARVVVTLLKAGAGSIWRMLRADGDEA
jgi:hypothetical protein